MVEIVDGIVKGNPSVYEIESFFANHDGATEYVWRFYEHEIIDYNSDNPIVDGYSLVLNLFGINYVAHGCTRVVSDLGNYVAKLTYWTDENIMSNNREVELWNLVSNNPRLKDYFIPTVGKLDSGIGDYLITIQPKCPNIDENGFRPNFFYFRDLGNQIRDELLTIGVKISDVQSVANYGFHEGRWKLLDYGNWKYNNR